MASLLEDYDHLIFEAVRDKSRAEDVLHQAARDYMRTVTEIERLREERERIRIAKTAPQLGQHQTSNPFLSSDVDSRSPSSR